MELFFDVGGTGTSYVYTENFRINKEKIGYFSTRNLNKDELLKRVSEIIKEEKPDIIGFSSPGAIVGKEYVSGLTGIKDYSNFNLKTELYELLEYEPKVYLLNDANAALSAELMLDEELLTKDVALISIGTGIGGAISLNGIIREGKRGMSGEFGYKIVDKNNNVSTVSSSRAIEVKYFEKTKIKRNAKEIFEIQDQEVIAKKVIEDAAMCNAENIFNIYHSFDFDLIILAGGITREEKYMKLIKEKVDLLSKQRGAGINIQIEVAKERDLSCLIGISYFAKGESKNE